MLLAPEMLPSRAVLTGSEIRLLDGGNATLRTLKSDARELRWSPDGATIALRAADGRLSLLDLREAKSKPSEVAKDAGGFAWGRDGRLVFGTVGRGISVVGADGKGPLAILPKAEAPAPSPDGTRLAFTVPGSGLWSAGADGANPRRLAPGERAAGASWSFDSRRLAWTDAGKMRMIRREGVGVRDLGPVEDARAFWSPGSADLLARREGSWAVWSARREAWTPLGVRSAEPPVWSGPRDLLAVEDGRLLEVRIGEGAKPVPGIAAVAVAERPQEFRGEAFPDPFRGAPKLKAGETAWLGRFVAFDPILGRVDAEVEAEVGANGTELNLSAPAVQRAEVADPRLARRLALPPETELRLTLREGKVVALYVPAVLESAPASPPAAPAATGRTLRPALPVEFDGITRETVVTPIVYPIPGKHSFVDTFLAPRGGGTRRHHGNDLMAPKMTPLLAVFDGTVSFARSASPGASNSLTLRSDDGWTASYLHINNDTPGTDDGLGSLRYAFPADLRPGDRVRAGEVVAWCGDSGNAEDAGSHLHFELYDEDGRAIIDPAPSLRAARRLSEPLYTDPDPSLKATKGEERWEGVVVSLDAAKRAATVELTGIGAPGGGCRRNLNPRLVYLQVPAGLTLGYRGPSGAEYPMSVLRPGLRVGAVGSVAGAKMAVRRATISLGAE